MFTFRDLESFLQQQCVLLSSVAKIHSSREKTVKNEDNNVTKSEMQ